MEYRFPFLEKPVETETLIAVIHNVLITLAEVVVNRCEEINALRAQKTEGGPKWPDDH